jgi:hypothetical protein
VVGSRPRRPGDRAPHPRRSVRRTPVRRAYKPSADDRSHRRVRFDEVRNPKRDGPPGDRGTHHRPVPREGRVQPARVARVTREGVYPATGDEGALREGCVRRPASQGVGSVDGSNSCVFEVRRLVPLRGSGGQGQGGAGCRLEGGTGKTLGQRGRKRQRGPGWRLAHAGSHETLAELGRRPTVMCGVL